MEGETTLANPWFNIEIGDLAIAARMPLRHF
jgi:hypothetical protein